MRLCSASNVHPRRQGSTPAMAKKRMYVHKDVDERALKPGSPHQASAHSSGAFTCIWGTSPLECPSTYRDETPRGPWSHPLSSVCNDPDTSPAAPRATSVAEAHSLVPPSLLLILTTLVPLPIRHSLTRWRSHQPWSLVLVLFTAPLPTTTPRTSCLRVRLPWARVPRRVRVLTLLRVPQTPPPPSAPRSTPTHASLSLRA